MMASQIFSTSEKPGARTPWIEVNQLLAPDERFTVYFPHWQGFLLAPKHSSQLAALLYLLHQKDIAFDIQGRGTHSLPTKEHSVIVSARVFSQIIWHEQGVVEVGGGCSLSHLHQFLFEKNQEVALEEDPLASPKRSVAGLVLSGKTAGIRYRAESFLETLLGAEIVACEGSRIKWGGEYRSALAGPTLHKLLWGLQSLPGVITKILLKTHPIPPTRLRLAWSFRQKIALWKQFHDLKCFSTTWEYLDVVLSGKMEDQGFVFAQISGFPEELDAFSQVCPGYAMASQQGEKIGLRNFLKTKKLHVFSVDMDHPLKPGEYLWVQDWNSHAWLLTPSFYEKKHCTLTPIWKQRLWISFYRR